MTTFNYIIDRPSPPNNPSTDVPDMKTNCNSINSILAVDHVSFNAANGGFHNVIHFTQQVSDPAADGSHGQLYTKLVTNYSNSDTALFFETGGGRIFQLTTNPGVAGVIPQNPSSGYSFLPGGFLIQYGFASSNVASPNLSVNFPIAFTTSVQSLQLCVLENSNSRRLWHLNSVTVSGFDAYIQDTNGTSVSNQVYWMAIGY